MDSSVSMNNSEINEYIRNHRIEAGLTQAALGQKLGVSPQLVSKWERGVCVPKEAQMKAMNAIFETEKAETEDPDVRYVLSFTKKDIRKCMPYLLYGLLMVFCIPLFNAFSFIFAAVALILCIKEKLPWFLTVFAVIIFVIVLDLDFHALFGINILPVTTQVTD